jgi:acyl-coenzyme A thioesterase PaaI-like protein
MEREGASAMDAAAIDRMLFEQVPFSNHVGAHITAVDTESAEAILPAAQNRLNHVGTVHAVAQFGLGEVATGALILGAFSELSAAGYAPVAASATITYLKAGRGDLRATSHFARADQEAVRAQVEREGKARFTIPVQLFDSSGQVITEMTVEWVLLKPR